LPVLIFHPFQQHSKRGEGSLLDETMTPGFNNMERPARKTLAGSSFETEHLTAGIFLTWKRTSLTNALIGKVLLSRFHNLLQRHLEFQVLFRRKSKA